MNIFLKSLLSSSVVMSLNAYAINMAYVEVNTNAFSNISCFINSDSQKPFFNMASIFAGNINGEDPNHPVIFLNPQVTNALNDGSVQQLQKKGIKVLLTLLGNHQNAGWSCATSEDAAKQFANNIVGLVNQYQLDGIDIDDEYSTCITNTTSLIMMAKAIKEHPGFKGKLLTKALFSDYAYFKARYQGHSLSEYLDYGWEMTYFSSDFTGRITPYLNAGMDMSQLMVGGWSGRFYPDPYQIGIFSKDAKTAGVMVYDVTAMSQLYLTSLQQGMKGNQAAIDVLPDCLSECLWITKK